MKFRIGFLLGAAAGAWAVNKASELQRGRRPAAATGSSTANDEATEKLRALSGLARERLSGFVDGPIGTMARDRISDLIGASLSGPNSKANSSSVNVTSNGSIDTDAWPR